MGALRCDGRCHRLHPQSTELGQRWLARQAEKRDRGRGWWERSAPISAHGEKRSEIYENRHERHLRIVALWHVTCSSGIESSFAKRKLVSRAPPLQEPDELIRHPVDRDVPRLDDLDEPMLLQTVDFEF